MEFCSGASAIDPNQFCLTKEFTYREKSTHMTTTAGHVGDSGWDVRSRGVSGAVMFGNQPLKKQIQDVLTELGGCRAEVALGCMTRKRR